MDSTRPSSLQVVDQNGARGVLDLTVVPPQGSESRLVFVRLDDGSSLFLDASVFVEQQSGIFFFPGSFADLNRQNVPQAQNAPQVQDAPQQQQQIQSSESSLYNQALKNQALNNQSEKLVVPVLAEQLRVARQQVVTGGVRLRKTVQERVEVVDEPVIEEKIDVERIAVNRFVDSAPAVRYEGDVMIVPLLEEVIVVEKRLVLREEVRIRKQQATVSRPQQVVLRREEATLEPIESELNQIEDENQLIGNE